MSAEDKLSSHIAVEVAIDAVLPGRVLRLRSIAVLAAHDVVRVEYEMTPPMDPLDWEADETTYAAWASRNEWRLLGRDDVGTAYDDWGGARGLTPDGEKTEGERDLHPAPPLDATWLEITFHAGWIAVGANHPHYTLRFILPLSPDSSGGSADGIWGAVGGGNHRRCAPVPHSGCSTWRVRSCSRSS